MKREFWNNLAGRYEDEIFSVLHNDRKKLVVRQIRELGAPEKTAGDYGCGIGHFLPYLSASFRKVFAIDISRGLIARAKKKCSRLSNVSYVTADLAAAGLRLAKTHFALSINTLIMPSLACRLRILDVMAGHILKKGHLVLVVPSLESAMLTDFRLVEMNLRNGFGPASAVRAGFEKTNHPRLNQGIVPVDNVPTKHYLREELVALLERRGLRILNIRKIEYPWNTEFDSPPHWLKDPLPWDWLIVAQKTN
ncbi:MAG: class I SAM-dependent methyltransferase [Sedimentisphaerales bacterium]|jgi:SAM-dependent methyltransferase